MAPPKLTRDAPWLNVFQPLEIDLLPVLRDERGLAFTNGLKRRLRKRLRVHVPLVGQVRLDDLVRAVAIGNLHRVRFDFFDKAERVKVLNHLGPRLKPVHAAIGSGHFIVQLTRIREDIDERQIMAASDFEVVEVVRGRDLHRARALLRIGVLVGDDGNLPANERKPDFCPRFEKRGIALVRGVHGHGRVAQHGLGPRRRDNDMIRLVALHFLGQRVFEIIQVAVRVALHQFRKGGGVERFLVLVLFGPSEGAAFLDRDDFKVGDRGLQLRVPVDKALVLVDQAGLVKLDEHLDDRLRQPLVHGEAFAAPIAGRAQGA